MVRLKREIQQLRNDYEIAREQNGELYELVEEEEHHTLDQWENDLANDVFSIEEEVEVSLTALEENQVNTSGFGDNGSHARFPRKRRSRKSRKWFRRKRRPWK